MTVSEIIRTQSIVKRQENILIAQEAAKSNEPWLLTKVNKYLARFTLSQSVDDILDKIIDDYLFAASFAKDPGKQNIAETVQIEELSKFVDIEALSNRGYNCMYIVDGTVYKGKPACVSDQKSVDAIAFDGEIEWYCTLKYTAGTRGGGQDNQKNNVINFIKNAGDKHVACILDGAYYQKEDKKKEMQQYASDKVFIGTSDEFIEKISARSV
tara:strand:- start:1092 stop:1727 length:636 start_codon:yes stop_codon:yes gene_type:complete